MKEAAITQSPYVYDPLKELSEKEIEERYRLRIDETYRPYTVFDVLQKVYRRCFSDDLLSYLGDHPGEFKQSEEGWKLSRAWVNELQVIRSESAFSQAVDRFRVDILADVRAKLEESRKENGISCRRTGLRFRCRLRYLFDLTPCAMTCRFEKVLLNKEDSLLKKNGLPLDKYLIPVIKSEDYERVAFYLHSLYYPESIFADVTIDPMRWLKSVGRTVRKGAFPENGALGEYFFGFGTADVVDEITGEVRNDYINPGTIIVNQELTGTRRILNSTLAHEGTHAFLGRWFFLLQMTHGHDYCSYMCKKTTGKSDADYQSPLERMEIQANTLPRFFLIPDYFGRKHAAALLESYGGERSLANMQKLVDDMAEYYGTTKTMARSRLMDFGYNEARGILRTVNGRLIPSYYSTLSDNETYSISEKDAIAEFIRNPEFRTVLMGGQYRYIRENGCYCLNDSRFLYLDHTGRPHLRQYAREHMGECCLVFRQEYENTIVRLVNGILRKDTSGRGKKRIQYVGVNGESPVTKEGMGLRRQIEKQRALKNALEMSFNDMTVKLMEKRKVTVSELAERTGLSDHTIKNMRNVSDIMFPIQEIVAVCIALHLDPGTSEVYIAKGPSKFLDTTEMYMYQYALQQWYEDPLPVVNRKLVEAGFKPLTDLVDGYDENGVRIAT